MGVLIRNCPHCGGENSTFSTFGEYLDPNSYSPKRYTTALSCGACHEGYIAIFDLAAGNTPKTYSGNLEKNDHLFLIKEYPLAIPVEAPQYLLANIENFYIQAAKALKTQDYDASAMMSRKVLEVSVKKLNPKGSGVLYKRIEQLYTLGKITDDLKDWAHMIRYDGNDAAHEEEPVTPEFAKELFSFVELFLMYTFTMPGMVKVKRSSQ